MTRWLLIVLTVVLMAGCQSWHGEATVTLKSGEKLRCPKGLMFDRIVVTCYGHGTETTAQWASVAGYEAR